MPGLLERASRSIFGRILSAFGVLAAGAITAWFYEDYGRAGSITTLVFAWNDRDSVCAGYDEGQIGGIEAGSFGVPCLAASQCSTDTGSVEAGPRTTFSYLAPASAFFFLPPEPGAAIFFASAGTGACSGVRTSPSGSSLRTMSLI